MIQIDEARIRDHLDEMVRGTVEETLNAMLDAEADRLCGAGRFAAGSRAHHKRNRNKRQNEGARGRLEPRLSPESPMS